MFSANSSQVSSDRLYVEDVFSTYLYTGNGSLRNITNGIDLATKGGMVWIKSRSSGSLAHVLYDTARGPSYQLVSNASSAEYYDSTGLNNFNSDGFQIWNLANVNSSGGSYASWTFREAPKFFDVVTYTGDGNGSGQTISHALGAVPGCIIIKPTSATGDWIVTSRKGASSYSYGLKLNATNAETGGWTGPSSTTTFNTFIGNTSNETNTNGVQYVAYLFAHDATSDGIIQCGSFTTDGSGNATVNLGWEPQWFLLKSANAAENWQIIDNMRNWSQSGFNPVFPNTSGAELSLSGDLAFPTATGCAFNAKTASTTYVYIAIRRGPMKTPTSGTSVFSPLARTGTGATVTITSPGFPPDLVTSQSRTSGNWSAFFDRLRGPLRYLPPNDTSAEVSAPGSLTSFNMTGVTLGADNDASWGYIINSTDAKINYFFRRAPSFFDVVCYTGTGSVQNVTHNLGVVPELMIVKNRANVTYGDWMVYHKDVGVSGFFYLNLNLAVGSTSSWWNQTNPTSTQFTTSNGSPQSNNGITFVAYLFASCPGVSKVGSYTGNGSSQTINCGFAAGARFVMIKRTDSTGDWYVWDSARGIVAGNDPHLSLNSTAAEVTTDDSVDTDSSGFVVNQLSATNINVSSATYIYLAVA